MLYQWSLRFKGTIFARFEGWSLLSVLVFKGVIYCLYSIFEVLELIATNICGREKNGYV